MQKGEEDYLITLLEKNIFNDFLSEKEFLHFQSEVWDLLAQRTKRYTMGDSSSIPVEVAKELLKSIGYCVLVYSENIEAIEAHIDVKKAFLLGTSEIERQVEFGKKLFLSISKKILPVENYFYQSVYEDIKTFFSNYDYHFFAHQVVCTPRYPLMQPIDKKYGIEYINEYLMKFNIENKFCRHFDIDAINQLVLSYALDGKIQYINIFELVFFNAIGLMLIDGDILKLKICKKEGKQLVNIFSSMSDDLCKRKIENAINELIERFHFNGSTEKMYFSHTALLLFKRIISRTNKHSLAGIFVICDNGISEQSIESTLADEEMMEDEALRELIDQITDCQVTSEKIILVKRNIHSLRDLVEVLNICFWGKECIQFFQTLETVELAILLYFIEKQQTTYMSWQSESRWEIQFKNYIEQLNGSKKQQIKNVISQLSK